MQAELRELFRLADPDHSKSIDLEEFRSFLSNLRSCENEPELFRRELQLRYFRSNKKLEEERQSLMVEAGLVAELLLPVRRVHSQTSVPAVPLR